MSRVQRGIGLFIMVMLATAITAAAQGLPQGLTPPDTTATEPSYDLKPKYEGTITGSITRVEMNNKFTTQLLLGNGYNAFANLSIGETHYRLQDRFSTKRALQVTYLAPIRVGLSGLIFDAALTENKTFDRVVTIGNQGQELLNNPRRLRAGLAHTLLNPNGVTMDWKVGGDLSKVDQTFQTDYNVGATANGAIKVKNKPLPVPGWVPMLNHWQVGFEGRGYYRTRYTETQDDTRNVREDDLGAEADSLKARISLELNPQSTLVGSYERFIRSEERMTFPRGVLGNQQFGAELIREAEFKNVRVATLHGRSEPLPGTAFSLRMEHRNDLQDFREQKEQFRHTVSDRIAGSVGKTFFGRVRFNSTFDWARIDYDLGELSVGSYRDERRQLRLTADFLTSDGKTAKLQTQAGISLLQTSFTDLDDTGRQINPRDRDQQDTYFNARLLSDPFPKVSTNIYMSITRAEFVSIDRQFSQNNRSNLTYDFRPELTYVINPRITVKQTYGLNVEFTDQFFERPGTEDLLDRNVTFTNDLAVKLTKKLSCWMVYTLLFHDRGSFLPQDPDAVVEAGVNERFFDVENEDRRDQMDLRFEYRINQSLVLLGRNRYSRRVDTFVRAERENVFADGAIELGTRGNYQWGQGRSLTFRLIRVKQFGRFARPEQEDFWIMNTEFLYAF